MLDRELIRQKSIFDTQFKPYIFTLCVIVKTLIFFSCSRTFCLTYIIYRKKYSMFNKLFLFSFFLQTPIKNRFLYKNVFILLYLLQVQQHKMRCDIDDGANDNRSEDEPFNE